jgi:hypothetical protein
MSRLSRALGPAGVLVALLLGLGGVAADEIEDALAGQPAPTPLPTVSPLAPVRNAPGNAAPPGNPAPFNQPASPLAPARPSGAPDVGPGPFPLLPPGPAAGAPGRPAPGESVVGVSQAECAWLLAGTWVADGVFTTGRLAGQPYRTSVSFRQFGNQVVGTQAEDSITYYGRCTVDSLELEVWKGWEQIGQQQGSVTADGQTISVTWTVWSPESMDGQETLTGRAQRLQR